MAKEKGLTKYVWLVIVILSLILISVASLFELFMTDVLKVALKVSGSSFTLESLDEGAVACLRGLLNSFLMYGICFGIFGLFCAWGLKKKESFAWKLGVLWSVLLIAYGSIAAVSEILFWWVHKPMVCPLLLLSIIAGVIALGCLTIVRKEFS